MHYHERGSEWPTIHDDTVYAIIDHPRDLINIVDCHVDLFSCEKNFNEKKKINYDTLPKGNVVEIPNIELFLKNCSFWGLGGSLLHEFSHFFHDYFLDFDNSLINNLFKNVESLNIYEKVDVHGFQGKFKFAKHYLLSNRMEYFAELSVVFHYRYLSLTEEEFEHFKEFEKETQERKFLRGSFKSIVDDEDDENIINSLLTQDFEFIASLDSKTINKIIYNKIKKIKQKYGNDSIILKKQSKIEKQNLIKSLGTVKYNADDNLSLYNHNKLSIFFQYRQFLDKYRYQNCYFTPNDPKCNYDHQEDEYNKWFPYNRFHLLQVDEKTFELFHFLWNFFESD